MPLTKRNNTDAVKQKETAGKGCASKMVYVINMFMSLLRKIINKNGPKKFTNKF